MIYVRSVRAKNFDDRTIWYRRHLRPIKVALRMAILLVLALLVFLLFSNRLLPGNIGANGFLLMLLFVAVAGWYTYSPVVFNVKKIRQIGWMKPFIVGFIWAGWVIVYPIVLSATHGNRLQLLPAMVWFAHSLVFFSINAVLFDIKDFRSDLFHRLPTLPVTLGVKRTFSLVIWPLLGLNFLLFFLFQYLQHFSPGVMLLQVVPHILLIPIILSLYQRKPVLYYLAIVDGLVLLKPLCGITSILFINK